MAVRPPRAQLPHAADRSPACSDKNNDNSNNNNNDNSNNDNSNTNTNTNTNNHTNIYMNIKRYSNINNAVATR